MLNAGRYGVLASLAERANVCRDSWLCRSDRLRAAVWERGKRSAPGGARQAPAIVILGADRFRAWLAAGQQGACDLAGPVVAREMIAVGIGHFQTGVRKRLADALGKGVVVVRITQGLLDVSADAEDLARRLVELGAVPREAAADAAHIANAAMRVRIERACREAGYEPPVICTPNKLMETGHGDDTG